MALTSSLYSYYTIKARRIAFLIFINNLLLLYLFKFSIFNLINILFVLTTVAVIAVAVAAFAATKVYEVVITYVKASFLSLFIVSFYFSELSLYPLIIFIFELPN